MRILTLLCLVLAAGCQAIDRVIDTGPDAPVTATPPAGRLPQGVRPVAYRLDLLIVPERDEFEGEAEIDIAMTGPVRQLWLHGRDLAVSRAELVLPGGETVTARYTQRTDDGVAEVLLERAVLAPRAMLRFKWRAPFQKGLSGLYKVTSGGADYAFTQLESIHARKVFPGFDEPAFKTPFTISVTTRAELEAIGNTRVTATEPVDGGLKRVRYAKTLPLPTYLVAFAVGPLDVVRWADIPPNEVRPQPLRLRGIAARGQGGKLAYALENTAPLLASLERYFDSPYPFDKLDLVAVPDFASGAMENAGLITYRESLLLLGDKPSVAEIRPYALIHAHELAHQWFGNLVTMPWWDDIWLNEAFASWIQVKPAHEWAPGFHFDREVQSRALRAMAEDSLVSARRIREPVNKSADIFAAFDGITYRKGAGVLGMLESYLGERRFRAGIRGHIKAHALGSATVYDLMDSLEAVAGPEAGVRPVFNSFLFQPGVPQVELRASCGAGEGRIGLAQSRYLPLGSAGDTRAQWNVPVCFAYGDSAGRRQRQCALLQKPGQSFAVADGSCPAWVMPNADGAGYYRFGLDAAGWDALLPRYLDALTAAERLALVDSMVAGVEAGRIEPGYFTWALPALARAPERLVIDALVRAYGRFTEVLWHENADRFAARTLAGQIFMPLLAEAAAGRGESPEEAASLEYTLTRFLAVDMSLPQLRPALRRAAQDYLGYRKDRGGTALNPNLLRPALIVAVQDGTPEFAAWLMEKFDSIDDARLRGEIMVALAHATRPAVVEPAREFALGDAVRGNELYSYLYWLLNPASQSLNWPWLQDNLERIYERAPGRLRRELPEMTTRWLCDRQEAARAEQLFTPGVARYTGSERELAKGLEQARLCAAQREAWGGRGFPDPDAGFN